MLGPKTPPETRMRRLRREKNMPVTPDKILHEDIYDVNLRLLMIPINHRYQEQLLYKNIGTKQVFPKDTVVYLESKHEKYKGYNPPYEMEKGKDYVYEEDSKHAYRTTSFVVAYLCMWEALDRSERERNTFNASAYLARVF